MLIWICQHSMEKKSCLTTLCDEIGWVDERRAVNIVCLDFSEAFSMISHSILINWLMKWMPGGWTAKVTGNCLTWWAPRVGISGTTSQVGSKAGGEWLAVHSGTQCQRQSCLTTLLLTWGSQRCTLSKLAGGADRPKRVMLLSRGTLTEELSDGNLQQFSKGKFSDLGEEQLQAPVCSSVQSAEKKVQRRTWGSWWERCMWALNVHLQRRPEVFCMHWEKLPADQGGDRSFPPTHHW